MIIFDIFFSALLVVGNLFIAVGFGYVPQLVTVKKVIGPLTGLITLAIGIFVLPFAAKYLCAAIPGYVMAENTFKDYGDLTGVSHIAPVIIKINEFGEKAFQITRTGLYFWEVDWWINLLKGAGIIVGFFILTVIINRSASDLDEMDEIEERKVEERNARKDRKIVTEYHAEWDSFNERINVKKTTRDETDYEVATSNFIAIPFMLIIGFIFSPILTYCMFILGTLKSAFAGPNY